MIFALKHLYLSKLNLHLITGLIECSGSGFVCAHTLPVLYEKYQDQVDDFLYNVLGLLQNQYQKVNMGALKGSVKFRKSE